MGVRNASAASTTIITAAPANGVDALLATTGLIGLVQDNAQVIIHWFLNVTTGAASTNYGVRLRRGAAVASTLINVSSAFTAAAASAFNYAGSYIDTPGILGQVQYSLTGIVTGGAAAVTINDVCLIAYVL